MSEQPQPLFIDTGAFFAWVNTYVGRHETAQSVFDALRREAIPYQPLFTSRYVLSELATLTSRKVIHKTAVDVLQTIRRSESFNILPVGEGVFLLRRVTSSSGMTTSRSRLLTTRVRCLLENTILSISLPLIEISRRLG